MRVKPEVADFLFLKAKMRGHAGRRADRDGVIPTKHEREEALAQGFFDRLANVPAGFRNFLKILRALFADGHFFGLFHSEVADVFHRVAELFDGGMQARTAEGGRAHVHAAAALAEVHGDADDANLLRHFLSVTGDLRKPCWNREVRAAIESKLLS